jgi:hypothetical protein
MYSYVCEVGQIGVKIGAYENEATGKWEADVVIIVIICGYGEDCQGWQNCSSDKLDSILLREASQQYPITDNRITNCVDTAAVVLCGAQSAGCLNESDWRV